MIGQPGLPNHYIQFFGGPAYICERLYFSAMRLHDSAHIAQESAQRFIISPSKRLHDSAQRWQTSAHTPQVKP
jgi:hypothetical protein